MSDWKNYTLDEFTDIRVSNVDKKSKPKEKPIQLCNYMDVYTNDYITADLNFMESTASPSEYERFKVEKGDVMITKDSETPYDIGIPSVVIDEIQDLVCGYHLALIKPNSKIVNSIFLSKQISASNVASYFSRMAAGSTRYGLSNRAIARTKVSLPPLANQGKIAQILQTIDRTITHTETLIEKYQQIKAGLMHDFFTRGIGADGKLRPPRKEAPELYQESAIGWIPREWIFTTCANVCEKIIDCKNRTPPITPEGYPVIRTPNVRNGSFVDNDLVFTDADSYLIWTERGKPKPDDIVITREAPVGEVCKIPERYQHSCLGQRMMLYRTDANKIETDFFLYALQSEAIQNRLDLISGGSTVGHVRVGDIRNLWIFYPKDKDEQLKISNSLNSISSRIETEINSLNKLKKLKSGLMHDLLTGKVPVKFEHDEAGND
jgi:type I restriction enzyme, S subunit